MAARIIDGKSFAQGLRDRVTAAAAALKAAQGLTPGLAVVIVGDDPASQIYVRNKGKQTRAAGMNSFEHALPAHTTMPELLALVQQLNTDPAVHGILVQLPLPAHLDPHAVIHAINPAKDVDGMHLISVGMLGTGRPGLVPCTPFGCMLLLKDTLGTVAGAHAVVLGRSTLVGRPMGQLLLNDSATVTMAHSRTRDLPALCRSADILVAATGQTEMVRGDWVKPGATVIDVGITRIDLPDGKTRIVGDVKFDEAAAVAGAITPVPGGVGPMTIACLLRNTLVAARAIHGLPTDESL